MNWVKIANLWLENQGLTMVKTGLGKKRELKGLLTGR